MFRRLGCAAALLQILLPGCAGAPLGDFDRVGQQPICIVSHHTEDGGVFAATSRANHQRYAEQHDYSYRVYEGRLSGDRFVDPARGPLGSLYGGGLYWQKLVAVEQMLRARDAPGGAQRCDWVMYVDADILFTNLHTRIEDLLERWGEPGTHLILSREEAGAVPINSGMFLLENSPAGWAALADVAALYGDYRNEALPDQDALTDYAFQATRNTPERRSFAAMAPRLRPGIRVLRQRVANSFYRPKAADPEAARWQPCDFVAHLSGQPGRLRAQRMAALAAEIARCDAPAEWGFAL